MALNVEEVADWVAYGIQLPMLAGESRAIMWSGLATFDSLVLVLLLSDLFRHAAVTGYDFPSLLEHDGQSLVRVRVRCHQQLLVLTQLVCDIAEGGRWRGVGPAPQADHASHLHEATWRRGWCVSGCDSLLSRSFALVLTLLIGLRVLDPHPPGLPIATNTGCYSITLVRPPAPVFVVNTTRGSHLLIWSFDG